MPKVSFVVPTKNREAWFPECLSGLLAQTESDIEVVVVNDGSTDGTKSLLDNYYAKDSRVKIIHNETSLGAGPSRNKGIEAATAPLIGVCDDDDVYPINRADRIVKFFEENPEGVMMNAPYLRIGFNNELLERFNGEAFDEDEFKKTGRISFFCHPAAAYTKKDILAIGGYKRETEHATDDFQLVKDWIDAGKKIQIAPDEYLCMHRVLPSSIMANMRGFDPKWAGK